MFDNKNIFILGMARSGYQAAKVLAKRGNKVLITDMKEQDVNQVKELEELGVKFIISDSPEDLLNDSFDIVIKNPGIRNDHKCILKANELNISVINEVEMCYELMPSGVKIIGITGSNGKTTTTSLIYEMIKRANYRVHLAGNIGYPLASIINDIKKDDILVIEISNFQLMNMYKFKTDITVLTNLSPSHTDFHGSYEEYLKSKKRMFNNQDNNDIAIINYANEDCLKLTSDILASKKYFNKDCYLDGDNIYYYDEMFINVNDIFLCGRHNYDNAMCAIMVAKEMGIDDKIIKQVLKEFRGVEHRIEYVKEINGIKFYNDSKSTNNTATITALKTFNTPIILILGGKDRFISYEPLKDYMKNVKCVISIGETKDKIKEFCDSINITCIVKNNLSEAVPYAYSIAKEFDTVLLSPASASLDQYKCFEDRGIEFKKLVNELR